MDNSKTRKSDAAATRKRRSSILKSQRAPRAPFSELEFNVATPQDQTKSRRVSFSRRTGVAEFEIHEATTAWKNVYEEHNKSLETSGNESGGARGGGAGAGAGGARVAHLGGRRADLFPDAELALLADPEPQRQLTELTDHDTVQLFSVDANPTAKDLTDALDVDFSAVAPLDDLDILQNDLQAERRVDMSEYNIDVDFNSTHFTLKADESDDMSITDSVQSPRVTAAARTPDDWTADKENVAVNPYVAPPPADFADDECDDVLVFDGKKCKFQSNLDLSDELYTGRRGRTAFDTIDVPLSKAPERMTTGDVNRSRGLSEREVKTVLFDDMADMTVTQAVSAQILQREASRRNTILYDDRDADIEVTQAVSVNVISPIQIACDDDVAEPETTAEKQKTMYFDDIADISVTQAVPANIIQERNDVVSVRPPATERRKTVVFGNDDGDLSITGALPANILDKEAKLPTERRRTIVYSNDDGDISMTGVVPAKIMGDKEGEKPVGTAGAERRKTIVYGDDDGNVSMTGVVPANIVVTTDGANLVPIKTTGRRKTIVYGNDDGDVSMTGVLPAYIIANEAKPAQSPSADRRKTIVYGNDEGNISMTGVVPANIMVETKLPQHDTDRRRTIVYNNDDGNISVTGVVPANIMVAKDSAMDQTTNPGRRKTIVCGNDDGNISMTGVVPANVIITDRFENETQPLNTERRKTVVYGNDDGNISVTGVVPTNIMMDPDGNKTQAVTPERRKTVVFENDDADISVTGVVPAIMVDRSAANETAPINTECREAVTEENVVDYISLKGVVLTNVMTDKDGAHQTQWISSERRKTVDYKSDDISMSGKEMPANITMDQSGVNVPVPIIPERRKTVVFGNDEGNISVTGVVPANIIIDRDEANDNPLTNLERRKTVVFGDEDGNISMTGVIPANIMDKESASQTDPVITACKETVMSQNEVDNFYKSKLLADNMDYDQNLMAANTELKKAVVIEKDDGNLSLKQVVKPEEQDNANTNVRISTDFRKSVYETEDCDVSMTEVLEARAMVDASKANGTLPHTELTKTIVCENEGSNLSMTDLVTDSIVEDRTKLDQTANADRRKSVGNNADKTMAEDDQTLEKENVEIIYRSNRKTIVYEDMEGDVSMTEAAPTGSEIHSKTTSQELENDDKDKNDKVPAHTSAAGISRQSLERTTKDTTQKANASSFQESLVDGIMVFETSVHNSVQQTETCDSNALLGEYIQEANDRRKSLPASSEYSIGVPQRSPMRSDSLIGTSGTHKAPLDTLSSSLLSDTSMPDIGAAESKVSSPSHGLYPILVRDRKSMIDRLSSNASPTREVFSKSVPPDSIIDLESQNSEPIVNFDSDVSNSSSPERVSLLGRGARTSLLDELARSFAGQTLASDVLSRSLAPNRVSILKELAPEAFEQIDRSPPSSVLDALLDMSSMDGEPLNPLPEKPDSDTSSDTVADKPAVRESSATSDDDREAGVKTDEESDKEEVLSDTRPKEDGGEEDEPRRRSTEHHVSFDEKCVAADISMEDESQQCAATQAGADDTRAILDALSDFTKTRRSEQFDMKDVKLETRRSVVPDRKSMVRSREDLLKDISMAQALMKTEMEESEEEDASPRREVVKTLCFDDDSPQQSPRVPHRPAPVESEQRRSHPIPSYLQSVSDNVKELINNLIKPMADVATIPEYAPQRDSVIQTDLRSSQINLVTSSQRSPSPPKAEAGILKRERQEVKPEPIRRRSSESRPIIFDPWNPLNNVVLPAASCAPHRYSPPPPPLSPTYSVENATQTERCEDHVLQCEMALITTSPLSKQVARDSSAGSEGERKRSHVPADPSRGEITPRPALKVQKVSSSVKSSRLSRSPTLSEHAVRSADSEVPFSSGALSTTSHELESHGSMTSLRAGDANVVSKIDVLPFMGSWECAWESRSADTWSFLLMRGRLRLRLRLRHALHNHTRAVRADTRVTHAALTHNADYESSDPVLNLSVWLVSAGLAGAVCGLRAAGAVPALLRRGARAAAAARRWARALHHARLALAYTLTTEGLLTLKVANIPLRCVWEVTLRVQLEQGEAGAWPRACDVTVTPLLAHWSPAPAQLQRLLAPVPHDWGHVPRTLWKIFKYLKNKRPEDDLVLGA